jgi:type IX secretion system PorP/SprF family membrane protein
MKFRQGLLFLCLLFSSLSLSAQDIHFTMFDRAPLTLNPAFTGAFEGTFRIGGIYRDQWRGLYRTPNVYLDAPILPGLGKMDWIGVGGSFYSDKAGKIAELTNSGGFLSAAYHLSLDKKRKTVLTFGIQGGTAQRRVMLDDNVRFGDQLEAQLQGQTSAQTMDVNIDTARNSSFTLNGGVLLTTQVSEKTKLVFGVGGIHLNGPEYAFTQGRRTDRDLRFNAHARADISLNDKWSLSPAFAFQTIGASQDVAPQLWAGYMINPEKQIRLNFGTGYRLGDAAEIMVGLDYEAFSFAVAYDLNISDATDYTNGVGGFEIAASYIARIYNKPEPNPQIFCPRF